MRFKRSDRDQNSRDAQAWQFVPQNGGLVIYCFPILMVLSPPSHVVLARMYSQFISRMMRLHSTPSVKIETERLTVKGLLERVWASLWIEHSTQCCDLYLKSGVCSFLDDNLPIWYRMCTARPAWHGWPWSLMVASRESCLIYSASSASSAAHIPDLSDIWAYTNGF